jgi:hypothetical protein
MAIDTLGVVIVSSRSVMAAIAAGWRGTSQGSGRLLAPVAVTGFLLGADTADHLGDEVVIGALSPRSALVRNNSHNAFAAVSALIIG